MSFAVEILTPDAPILKADVTGMTVPGTTGSLGVLTGHAPMICSLGLGVVALQQTGSESLLVVDQGVMEVFDDHVKILVDNAWAVRDEAHASDKIFELRQQKPSALLKWMMR